ncbi:MAG: peptide chain release factor-like protein [Bdellovibrionales bacterium]|nr:peptide chain release factor-like protein [Bdellovibrionales bacterium]
MAKYPVSPQREANLIARMQALEIREEDLIEKFIRGSGKGGQKINKTSSCVYLLHIPSGIEVKCQKERSQALNRFFARRELCDKLEEQVLGQKSKKRQEAEKIRRQKRKRSKRAKEKMLNDKKHQGEKKRNRRGSSEI